MSDDTGSSGGMTRRKFLGASTATPFVMSMVQDASALPVDAATGSTSLVPVSLNVNGIAYNVTVDPRNTLLDLLRERLALTGTKKGCDQGQCGACTVLIGKRRALACLTLSAAVREPVITIEGLTAANAPLHPMQQAFLDQDAFQCGYCTPGQIMSAIACIQEGHARTDADIREYMSGNLCRCAAYPHIVAAIKQAKPLIEKP